jgi:phospholipid/cholesterol/gamma-HCH transport system substrate-binding protein
VPSQQEVRWSQLKVGVLVIAAVVILIALVFLMSGGTGGLFTHKVILRAYFENAAGLKVGAPVNLEGVTIGNVKAIRIVPERRLSPVEVSMKVSGGYERALHTDTVASLDTVGVLGDTVVDLNSKKAVGPPPKNNDELPTTETPNLSNVIKASQGTIEQLNTILDKVNKLTDSLTEGKGSIGKLIQDPALYNQAQATVLKLQALVDAISNGKGSIGKLVADDELYNRANDTVGRLEHVATQIDSGKGTIGKLIYDETMYNNLNATLSDAHQLIADINAGKGGLGMIAKDPQFAKKLDDTVTKLQSILSRIDSGEGTVGQLVRNPSLYNSADEMLVETRNLVTGIRENPKKYLTFHVKIF